MEKISKKIETLSGDKEQFQSMSLELKSKLDKADIDIVMDTFLKQKTDMSKMKTDIEGIFELLKNDLESIRQSTFESLNKKIDNEEIDRILQILNRKTDVDQVNSSLVKLRDEVSEEIGLSKDDILVQMREIEGDFLKKGHQTNTLYEEISNEVSELNSQIRKVLDERNERQQVEEANEYTKKIGEALQEELYTEIQKIEDVLNQIMNQVKDLQREDSNNYAKKLAEGLRSELVGEVQKLENKINQTKGQLGQAQIEESTNYVKKVAEALQQEFYGELQRLEDGVNQAQMQANEFQSRESINHTKKVTETLQQELHGEVKKLENTISLIRSQTRDSYREESANYTKKVAEALQQEFFVEVQRLDDLYIKLREALEGTHKNKLDTTQLDDLSAKFQEQLDSKTDLGEVQDALNNFSADISRKFTNMREDFNQIIKEHEDDVLTALKKKASLADLNNAIVKLDAVLTGKINEKSENSNGKSPKMHVSEENLGSIRRQMEDIRSDLISKASIDEVARLLDSKTSKVLEVSFLII